MAETTVTRYFRDALTQEKYPLRVQPTASQIMFDLSAFTPAAQPIDPKSPPSVVANKPTKWKVPTTSFTPGSFTPGSFTPGSFTPKQDVRRTSLRSETYEIRDITTLPLTTAWVNGMSISVDKSTYKRFVNLPHLVRCAFIFEEQGRDAYEMASFILKEYNRNRELASIDISFTSASLVTTEQGMRWRIQGPIYFNGNKCLDLTHAQEDVDEFPWGMELAKVASSLHPAMKFYIAPRMNKEYEATIGVNRVIRYPPIGGALDPDNSRMYSPMSNKVLSFLGNPGLSIAQSMSGQTEIMNSLEDKFIDPVTLITTLILEQGDNGLPANGVVVEGVEYETIQLAPIIYNAFHYVIDSNLSPFLHVQGMGLGTVLADDLLKIAGVSLYDIQHQAFGHPAATLSLSIPTASSYKEYSLTYEEFTAMEASVREYASTPVFPSRGRGKRYRGRGSRGRGKRYRGRSRGSRYKRK